MEEVEKLQETVAKLTQQVQEATRRENVLNMRLATKQQELQDTLVSSSHMNYFVFNLVCLVLFLCILSSFNWMINHATILSLVQCIHHVHAYITQTQVHDLKQSQSPSTAQLHSMLMDPAVNLMFLKMKSELKDVKEKLAQAQTDLSAWKFSTDRSVGTATVSIVRRVLTNYYIDRCFMTTCLLYHMICMLCHMHHCSHEPSSMSQPTHHKHNTVKIQNTSILLRLHCSLAWALSGVLCSDASPLLCGCCVAPLHPLKMADI